MKEGLGALLGRKVLCEGDWMLSFPGDSKEDDKGLKYEDERIGREPISPTRRRRQVTLLTWQCLMCMGFFFRCMVKNIDYSWG